jgi:hypothetical protein
VGLPTMAWGLARSCIPSKPSWIEGMFSVAKLAPLSNLGRLSEMRLCKVSPVGMVWQVQKEMSKMFVLKLNADEARVQ